MAWSDIFIPSGSQTADEQAANYAAQQDEYARRKQARIDEGTYNPALDYPLTSLEDQNAAARAGFVEGLSEGPANVRGWLADALSFPFKLIPPLGWLLIVVGLFLWLGGFAWLRGKLK
jgi:hypothetical protein